MGGVTTTTAYRLHTELQQRCFVDGHLSVFISAIVLLLLLIIIIPAFVCTRSNNSVER